jgi:hypothetical protein
MKKEPYNIRIPYIRSEVFLSLLENEFHLIGFCWEALAGSVEGTKLGSSSPAKCWWGGFCGIQDSLKPTSREVRVRLIHKHNLLTQVGFFSDTTHLITYIQIWKYISCGFVAGERLRRYESRRIEEWGIQVFGVDWERVWHFVAFRREARRGWGDAECVSDAKLKLRPRDCVTPMPHHALCFMPASTYCDLLLVVVVIVVPPTREEWS